MPDREARRFATAYKTQATIIQWWLFLLTVGFAKFDHDGIGKYLALQHSSGLTRGLQWMPILQLDSRLPLMTRT